jgi:DNA-binding NarL/FixJ family response regulator
VPTTTEPVEVLVVDDHTPFRDAARAVVKATPGFEAVGDAASGSEGFALAGNLRPDLVLLDVTMDGLDGIETCRLLTQTYPDTVVVLVSIDEHALHPTDCGAVAFLRKQDLCPRVLRAIWDEHRRGASLVTQGRSDPRDG